MSIKFGGVVFPLAARENLLEVADPVLFAGLAYFKDAFNHHLGNAYRTALAGQSRAASGEEACAETTHLDPVKWLSRRTFRHPLLAIFPNAGTTENIVVEHPHAGTKYKLAYVLPKIDTAGAERLLPILQAVRKLVAMLVSRQGDDSHQGNKAVWIDAEATSVSVGNCEYGELESEQGASFPAIFIELEILERLESYEDDSPDLEGVNGALDLGPEDDETTTLADAVTLEFVPED